MLPMIIGKRQMDGEGRSLFSIVCNLDGPAVAFNDLFDDCQPQACSMLPCRKERLKNVFNDVRTDAGTIINDRENDLIA